jgi:hypothetical protein
LLIATFMRIAASLVLLAAACGTEPTTHVEDLPGARNEAFRTASAKYGISED